ncbi:ras GTPase-activating protein-binding protein 2 [Galendromus occidentalis]|uniref:Ras GTPase-activating protein-binding protein 2 n=1 Tax=Galendromus occidentalis TaxID=34638 RepID=A0AAJ6QRK9_9ACAR|nr:ras GTPase-activating protein-binding protein 2 [Galendromus occidentalis]
MSRGMSYLHRGMVMVGGNGISAQDPPANPSEAPDASRVAREFVRQYYTILHSSPVHLHRFYNDESEFIHGSIDTPSKSVRGQQDIHEAIMALNFRDCYAKIHYVDAQESENKMVVVQVAGQLTNQGGPMRRFMQTFILVQLSARKYYVRNDIFRYQDQVFGDEEELDDAQALEDQAHAAQPIFNGGAVSDHVTLNGEHGPENSPASATKDDNQWDNSMAAQTPAAQTTQVTPTNSPVSTQTTGASTISAVAQETTNAAPRSWSQMVQKTKTSDPVTPPAATQPSFGPPANSANTFGGSAPSQGLSQRPAHRGNNNGHRSNGGPTPPKKDSHGPHPKDDETSPNSKQYVPDNLQLFVGNIPQDVEEKTLIEVFSKYGKVQEFRLSASKNIGGTAGSRKETTNFGFVCFDSVETVQKALEDGRSGATWEIDGKTVKLNLEEKKSRLPGGPKGPRGLNNGQRGGERRPMPNGGGGGGRREFNGRPQRSGPPRQNSSGNQSGPAPQPHPQAQQH